MSVFVSFSYEKDKFKKYLFHFTEKEETMQNCIKKETCFRKKRAESFFSFFKKSFVEYIDFFLILFNFLLLLYFSVRKFRFECFQVCYQCSRTSKIRNGCDYEDSEFESFWDFAILFMICLFVIVLQYTKFYFLFLEK